MVRMLFSAPSSFWILSLFRTSFLLLVLFVISQIIEFGTASWLLGVAIVLGVALGTTTAFSTLRSYVVWLSILAGYLLLWSASTLVSSFSESLNLDIFAGYSFWLHASLFVALMFVALLSTLHFWRTRQIVSLEIVALGFALILLLSGHRQFRLDNPQFINDIAWSLSVGNLAALIGVSAGAVALILVYLYAATLPSLPTPSVSTQVKLGVNELRRLFTTSVSILILIVFAVVTSALVQRHYGASVKTRVMNGVGEEQSEGVSPLNFHSALGASNQPAGLVRLEGDYQNNPFSPMLYLRESALSLFNGSEMVMARPSLDADISRSRPGEPFKRVKDEELIERVPITQSMYLLTNHENAFAIDYPLEIVPLKNPNPQKFKGAFRAESLAPSFALQDLIGRELGDERWTPDEWKHYLQAHPDERYSKLAGAITQEYGDNISKAAAIVEYLNKNSTYTLKPNHEIEIGDDQTAAYLFGDLRGYCVHFAHATVFMLRALGIPSRIATGYMTDLSQSKDGHILLRMSDRHAWAEIYVRNVGWVPFDTQPENVESHAETPVDMNLLEELMSMLGPDETLLPEDLIENEYGFEEENSALPLPDRRQFGYVLLSLFILLYGLRTYLRYCWVLPSDSRVKMRRLVRAYMLELSCIGIRRNRAETRHEFERRLTSILDLHSLKLTALHNAVKYSEREFSDAEQMREIIDAAKHDFSELRKLHPLKRILLLVNPLPQLRLFLRGAW